MAKCRLDEWERIHEADTMVTASDLQDVTGIHATTILAYAREGRFPIQGMPSGNRVLFPKEAALRWFRGETLPKVHPVSVPETPEGMRYSVNIVGNTVDELIANMRAYIWMFEAKEKTAGAPTPTAHAE